MIRWHIRSKTGCSIVLGLLALSLFSSIPRVGAAGPAITVNPANPLIGQLVTVVGSGFPASSGGTVWIDLNGNGMLDKFESAYSSKIQTSGTGGFVAFLLTSGLAMSTYNVMAQVPDGSTVVASAQVSLQDPAVNAIQNAQTVLSKQIIDAQSAISSQLAAVQSDLDNKIGSPKQGSSDTLFSLLYGIQNSISAGFSSMQTSISNAVSQLSSQISGVQTDLDNKIGLPQQPLDCAPPPCPPDTVFSLLYGIQNSLNNAIASISNSITSLSTQLSSVQKDLDNRIGSPNTVDCAIGSPPPCFNGDTVFSLLYGLQTSMSNGFTSTSNSISSVSTQLTTIQSDLDNKIGTPSPSETVFGDLQAINFDLPAVQKSLTNIQTNMGTPNTGETVFGDLANIATFLGTPTSTSVNTLFGQLNTIRDSTNSVSNNLGSPNGMIGTSTAFGLLYGLQYSITVFQSDVDNRLGTAKTGETVFGDLQSINLNLPAVQKSLTSIQTNIGTPNSGETVFGDLQNIQTSLNSLTGLQTSINNLQNSLNKLSNTATVFSGSAVVHVASPDTNALASANIPVFHNSKVCTVTVTLLTRDQLAGEVNEVTYADSTGALAIARPPLDTDDFSETGAASTVIVSVLFPPGDTNTALVSYMYSAVCPAS